MKALRIRITHLKNKIEEKFPNSNDLLGYQGINKPRIIESLTESYSLLSTISEYQDRFETIFAKREIAESVDSCNHFLDNILPTTNAQQEFNSFLNSIARIRFVLKETYISISDNPLRVDYEIINAKEQLASLKESLTSINDIKTQIDQTNLATAEFIEDLRNKHTTAIENDTIILEMLTNVNEIEENLKGTNEKISIWKSEIQSIREDIVSKQGDILKLKKELEQLLSESKQNETEIGFQIEMIKTQTEINRNQQDHIQKTIEDVSRYGMAGSFKKRKDELKYAQWIWAGLTLISLSVLLYISNMIIEPLLDNGVPDVKQLLFKVPMLASAVWLGWFCSRQYGFNTRIREDYAYKYAISMAFEGYKNETKKINEELLEKLIELTIFNAARSPERIFNTKTNPGSPYNEMFDTLARNLFSKRQNEDNKQDD